MMADCLVVVKVALMAVMTVGSMVGMMAEQKVDQTAEHLVGY
jgi:Tfp pilus assembly protein FimT